LRFMLPAQLLLLCSVAFGGDEPASCEIASKSIVNFSAPALAQVSNLDGVWIKCSVPTRPFPTKPGEVRYGLKVATVAYQIAPDGNKKWVPSEVQIDGGGGFGPDPTPEWVDFGVLIPLEPADRDAEVRKLIAKLKKATGRPMTKEGQRGLERLRELVAQQRVGHFQVECRVMDGDRVMGVGVVEFEVLFKGHFSDVALPGAPPA